jgi:glucosamine 6-phosphate synthetase-like amidotransferase/phosphosugar isomerase protein
MCGIAGIWIKGDPGKINLDAMLSTMLESIEHRGGHATGFVALTDEGVGRWQKAACGAKEFNEERRSVPMGARTIIGHTRWATQGSPGFMENNHPLKRGPFFIIHNGHVHNDIEMFQSAKRKRYGLVDSECIAASLSNQGTLAGLPRVMEEIDGAAAVAAVDERSPRDLALARGQSSPMFVLETKRLILFASTERCVIDAHKQHIGDVKKKAVREIEEGTFIHLRHGQSAVISRFHVPVFKKAWSWLDHDKDKDKDKSYSGTIYGKIEDEWLECDVCAAKAKFDDMEYLMEKDGDTMMLCHTCYDWLNDPLEDDDAIDANPLDERFARAFEEGRG